MIGMGCMRLSTAKDRDHDRGIATIHAALDAGVTLLDTADAYCHSDADFGHNELLVAEALRTWSGDRSGVVVATKGGLTRPRGEWTPNGKASYLRGACEASLKRLGVSCIDLYQWHTPDPRTPFTTGIRALAALRKNGLVQRVGLSNVTLGQLKEAMEMVEVASVQVSWSLLDDTILRNGVAAFCLAHGIQLIAHRPLGGDKIWQLEKRVALRAIADAHQTTPPLVALAWLASFGAGVVPIPGATRPESARSLGDLAHLTLTTNELQQLDRSANGQLLRTPQAARRPADDATGDVVLVMGIPGAGKSTHSAALASEGYRRLNRDATGGSLADLVPLLDAGLAAGERRWVLDNTYPSRAARNDVIECAWRHGVPVRCIWMQTTLADAQRNAVDRMLRALGHLPSPEEIRELGRTDPRFLSPDALFKYERTLEAPELDEGFEHIDAVSFVREPMPVMSERALVMEGDVLLRDGDDGALHPAALEILTRYGKLGRRLMVQFWRPQIARGTLPNTSMTRLAWRLREAVGADVHVAWCPHDAGPPVCWCRKPLPGLISAFAMESGVDFAQSIYAGHSAADRTLAERLDMRYLEVP